MLMSAIRCLVANAGVQAVVVLVVKIVGDAGLRVGQVGKNRPLAEFEHLRFEPGPEAFGLGVVVALAAAALRAHGLVVVQELPQCWPPWSEWTSRLGLVDCAKKVSCKAVVTNSSGIVAPMCQPITCLVPMS